jgi:hypothetical protein
MALVAQETLRQHLQHRGSMVEMVVTLALMVVAVVVLQRPETQMVTEKVVMVLRHLLQAPQ